MIIEQDGKRYFSVGYKLYELPDTRCKAFFNGKQYNYTENIGEWIKSDKNTAVAAVYCTNVSEKRAWRRVTFITKQEQFDFTNSEKGLYSYYRNQINDMKENCAYFIFLEKKQHARNDCLIKACMEIEKQEVDDSPACSLMVSDPNEVTEELIEEMSMR